MKVMLALYDRIVDPDLLIRRVNVVAADVLYEKNVPDEKEHEEQMSLLVDYEALEREKAKEAENDRKERNLQEATLKIQEKYGRNAMLKGVNLMEGATSMMRNKQIGGHSAGE